MYQLHVSNFVSEALHDTRSYFNERVFDSYDVQRAVLIAEVI